MNAYQYLGGWEAQPRKAEEKYGTPDGRVVIIGKYEVTVPNDTAADVTFRAPEKGWDQKDPRQAIPGMEVIDGEVRIPIEGLVPVILERMEPFEVARALWQDDGVRWEFVSCLATRYSDEGVTDTDRRKWLHAVKSAVHDKALDDLASVMNKLEYAVSKQSFFYHEVNRINDMLRDMNCLARDGSVMQLRHDTADREFDVGKKFWNEAREYWRKEVLGRFPAPDAPVTETVAAVFDGEE